jgi:hypothetical protein
MAVLFARVLVKSACLYLLLLALPSSMLGLLTQSTHE